MPRGADRGGADASDIKQKVATAIDTAAPELRFLMVRMPAAAHTHALERFALCLRFPARRGCTLPQRCHFGRASHVMGLPPELCAGKLGHRP